MPRRLRALFVPALALTACSGDGAPKGSHPLSIRDASQPTVGSPGGVTVSTHRRGGTPHHAVIDLVAVDSGGAAALSRDAIGEWRVWPSLDGALPTQRVPIDGALDAVIGTTSSGFVVAAVDSADGLDLLRLAPDGTTIKRSQLAPDPGVDNVIVVGDRAVVSLADQSVIVLDGDAKRLGRLGLRGARVEALVAAGADRAVAVLRKAGSPPTFEARWIDLGATVTWGATVALTAPFAPVGDHALSSDGRLLAYTTAPLPPRAEPTATGAPSRPPPVAAVPTTVQIAIVDLTTGKALAVTEPSSVQAEVSLGFISATDLMVIDQNQGSRIAIDIAAGTTVAFGDGLQVPPGPSAFAAGIAVGGVLTSLAVARGDGSLRFLGHKDGAPTTGALAPSGRTTAWLSTAGALIVERLDEDHEHVITPDNHTTFSLVELIDDHTAVVLSNQSVLQMFDVDTGAVLGDTPVTAAAAMQYDATTKLLLVPSGNTVWLYALDRAAPRPFGKRMVVPETAAVLLDPDLAGGAVLLGIDGATIRRYTLDELTTGVSRTMARDNRVTLPAAVTTFDRAARPYAVDWREEAGLRGRYLQTWPQNVMPDPWDPKAQVVAKVPDDTAAVIPAPAGNRFIAYDNRGTLLMFDARGAVTWSAAMPTIPSRIAWSDTGERVLVVSRSGGELFDAATGAALARACGWRFIADASPPNHAPMGVASVCTAAVQR